MNREINFRAWDGEQMSTFTVGIDSTGYLNSPPVPPKHFDKTKNGFKVLMQFTGLHDKNGKEIYEGDVVSSPSFSKKREVVAYSSFFAGFTPFCEQTGGLADTYSEWNIGDDVEVIGNIYENEDLLK